MRFWQEKSKSAPMGLVALTWSPENDQSAIANLKLRSLTRSAIAALVGCEARQRNAQNQPITVRYGAREQNVLYIDQTSA